MTGEWRSIGGHGNNRLNLLGEGMDGSFDNLGFLQ